MNSNKKYTLNVEDGAFDKDSQRGRISDEKTIYNATISKMNRAVEELDRYDDFESLKIDVETYRKNGNSEYGIPTNLAIQTNGAVILDHQKRAALSFLKELRGFGLLADVVGSGKTFEACVVLSELAVRNKIRSMLIIVPSQVYETWINVLEKMFGLGIGTLYEATSNLLLAKEDLTIESNFLIPNRPIIVKTEDFVQWSEDTAKYLFDVIVVDEAHHLCQQEGRYAKTIRLLSLMMETKKRANSTYCVLLSATPHSGNLDKMFRLWYFIRCKGGNPSDFEVKEEKDCSSKYQSEKRYYKEHVCRGASTVMEFIANVKRQEIEANPKYLDLINQHVMTLNSGKLDEESLAKMVRGREYKVLSPSEQLSIINSAMQYNEEFDLELTKRVASAYHNGVLRSIMIRQPKNPIAKKKNVVNILFYPTKQEIGEITIKGIRDELITVDCTALNTDHAVCVNIQTPDEKKMSIDQYIKLYRGNRRENEAFADLMIHRILNKFGDMNDSRREVFTKQNSTKYYLSQLRESSSEVDTQIYPITFNPRDLISHKLEKTIELLEKHSKERVIVFFDYDKSSEESVIEDVAKALNDIPALAKRILIGDDSNNSETITKFNKTENAILLVKKPSFTEGANLQKCAVIINFEITPDPLAMDQRIGRVFRLGQSSDVIIYSMANMNTLEGYVLMYFIRIGLLGSNFGDATIIAGSNNERMVAVRCSACKSVRLLSQEEYEKEKRNNELYCRETELCTQHSSKGTLMEEICVYDFKCDKCGSTFTRTITEGGYRCISDNNTGREIMCNSGEKGDRKMYCRKICAIAHCDYFQSEAMKGKCLALTKYNQNHNISDSDLLYICARCQNKACQPQCKVGLGTGAISECSSCTYAQCSPKPHTLSFNEKWEATCPKCKESGVRGTIKPIEARTFAAYICGLWDFEHDKGKSFCTTLLSETAKVSSIKRILEMDSTK